MAEPRPNQDQPLFHTWTPRLLASFSPLMFILFAVIVGALEARGLVTTEDGAKPGTYEVDPSISRGLTMLTVVVFVLPIFAWGWWYVAAMSNARARSIHAGSPWMFPVSVIVVIAASVANRMLPAGYDMEHMVLGVIAVLAYIMAAYGVLFSVRKSALAVKGETRYWNRLLWLPWASVGLSVVLVATAVATTSRPILVVAIFLPFAVSLWGWATWCMGMASFDRACRAYQVARDMNSDMPAFMMGQKALR